MEAIYSEPFKVNRDVILAHPAKNIRGALFPMAWMLIALGTLLGRTMPNTFEMQTLSEPFPNFKNSS